MEAGWYRDPTGRFEGRYHDGYDWTPHVSSGGAASADPLPSEDERPLSIRRTCPVCRRPDVVVTMTDGARLTCLDCGAELPFNVTELFGPDDRARLLADDVRHRATIADWAADAWAKRGGGR